MHLLGVQGFYFCPATYELPTSVYSGFYSVHAIIQPKCQNRLQGFTAAFPLICPIPAHTIQQIHKPPIHRLRHAGGHTIKRCTRTDTRHQRHARTLYSSAQPPHYNKVYKGTRVRPVIDPCPAGQHSTDHASSNGSARHTPPGGAVQQQERGRRRGTIGGKPPLLFSGFRPIANRGQQ